MSLKSLYIDELGSTNPHAKNGPVFVLSGCSFGDLDREKAKILSDQVKFKYWGRTDIIFHSREIGKNEGSFSIFKNDPALKSAFIKDLLMLLRSTSYHCFISIIDKTSAITKNWNKEKIMRDSTSYIVETFALYLLGTHSKGKITIESAANEQNQYFLKAFNQYLAPKALRGLDYKKVQHSLTSMSFVTKKNHDIEQQITDMMAYAARCKYLGDSGVEAHSNTSYEGRIIKVLNQKLYSMPANVGADKKKYLGKIQSFKILTK